MSEHEQTIYIPQDALAAINHYLTDQPSDESECLSEDETIVFTAYFDDGYEMDIKCCGVQFREGESNTAWSEAVLFHHGSEVCYSEPSDTFEGDWTLLHGSEIFTAHVRPSSQDRTHLCAF